MPATRWRASLVSFIACLKISRTSIAGPLSMFLLLMETTAGSCQSQRHSSSSAMAQFSTLRLIRTIPGVRNPLNSSKYSFYRQKEGGQSARLRLLTKYRQSSRFPRELCAFMGHAERTRSTAAGDGVGDDRVAGATRSSAAED